MKLLPSILLALVAFGFFGCQKDNPQKRFYYYGKWEVTKVEVGYPGASFEASSASGTFDFNGYRKKAKRGKYDINFTVTYFHKGQQKTVTVTDENEFLWWHYVYNIDEPTENYAIGMSLPELTDRVMGVSNTSFHFLHFKDIDENSFTFQVSGGHEFDGLNFYVTVAR